MAPVTGDAHGRSAARRRGWADAGRLLGRADASSDEPSTVTTPRFEPVPFCSYSTRASSTGDSAVPAETLPHVERHYAGGSARRAGYELEFEDTFDDAALNRAHWIPHYLPQWSNRQRSAARYAIAGGCLRLLIEANQPPWCPEFDGSVRVSSLQTGLFAGPLGTTIGQHRFNPEAVVREEQENLRLYTPQYGLIEMRAKALDDPRTMVALWMIGYEDEPERSAEICICEIFGRDVGEDQVKVGTGVHPFGDPRIVDDFSVDTLKIDARRFHVYAAEWTAERITFLADGQPIRTVQQSPAYPMQLMLGVYEFPDEMSAPPAAYPKVFTVDYVRGYQPVD